MQNQEDTIWEAANQNEGKIKNKICVYDWSYWLKMNYSKCRQFYFHIRFYSNTPLPYTHNVTTSLTTVILGVKGLIIQTEDGVAKWIKGKNINKNQLRTESVLSPIKYNLSSLSELFFLLKIDSSLKQSIPTTVSPPTILPASSTQPLFSSNPLPLHYPPEKC